MEEDNLIALLDSARESGKSSGVFEAMTILRDVRDALPETPENIEIRLFCLDVLDKMRDASDARFFRSQEILKPFLPVERPVCYQAEQEATA